MLSLCLQICLLCSQQVLLVLTGIKDLYESSQVHVCVRKKRNIIVSSNLDLKCRKKKKALYLRNIWGKNAE